MKKHFIIIISLIVFASCSTYVPVKKVLEPEIELPPGRATFLFASNFNADSLPFNNDNKVEVFKMGHKSFLEGLTYSFDTCRYYDLNIAGVTSTANANTKPATPRTQDSSYVNNLCTSNNSDYLIMLDAYNLYFDKEVEVTKNEDGSKSRKAYYDLVAATYVSLYDHTGNLLEQTHDELRIAHDKRAVLSGFLAVGPSMGKADKNAKQISYELGNMYVQKFTPVIVYEQRRFYHTKVFKAAYKAYLSENWRVAEEELLRLAESDKQEVAGRAAYNMSVLYENINRPDDEEYWYKKARRIMGSKFPDL